MKQLMERALSDKEARNAAAMKNLALSSASEEFNPWAGETS